MKTQAAIDHILAKLSSELRVELCYHSLGHTESVIANSKAICMAEAVPELETRLVLTAAAYHDSGFLQSYTDHELHGCQIARETLPQFEYSATDINAIEEMIMATKIPQAPTNRLAMILCDADLLYLGGDDYESIASALYLEMKQNGSTMTEEHWLELQVSFIEAHRFLTEFAKQTCNGPKAKRLAALKARLS